MNHLHTALEWWDSETVNRERATFDLHYGNLEGKTYGDLCQIFGEPDVFIQGGHKRGNDGIVTFVGDSAQYHALLRRTTVGFAVYEGIVHNVYFMPKVKKCSPERQSALGKTYAPD